MTMLAKTTLDPVQVRLSKGMVEWRHGREWRSKKLDTYFAEMLAPYGAEPAITVPEKFVGAWFVVQAAPSQERVAAGALIGRRLTCYLPMRRHKERGLHGHHHREVERPMLPGYLFASFATVDALNRITYAPGVLGVLSFNIELPDGSIQHRPVPIPVARMQRIRDKEVELANGTRVLRVGDQAIDVGATVQVIEGPFASFFGSVVELVFKRERVKVEVDIFGRKVPIDLDVGQLTVI
jgi:transcription antitermination factor NusG